jgi:hypothetical protein
MRIIPLDAQGVQVAAAVKTIAKADITYDDATKTIKANPEISTTDGYNQYLVEVRAGNNVILKAIKYVYSTQKNGNQIPLTVDVNSTAEVLTYDLWKANAATAGATSYTFADFKANLAAANQANFTTLVNNIQTELDTDTVNADLSTVAGANAAALSVSNNTPANVQTVLQWNQAAPMVFRGHEIYFEDQDWGPANEDLIGLSFFSYEVISVYSHRLGNFFHFFPRPNQAADNTAVIAYAGQNVNALNQANSAAGLTWHTNSLLAKGSEMAVGDVYYFRVEKDAGVFMYGAIKVDAILAQQADQANLEFSYKYNRNVGDTNLTVQ